MDSFLKSDIVKKALIGDFKYKALAMNEIFEFFKSDDVFDCENPQSRITIDKFARVFLPIQSQVETYQKTD